MTISRTPARLGALLVAAALAAPVAQANPKDGVGLDVTNLPCAPSCPQELGTGGVTEPTGGVVLQADGFDWGDAGIGVGAGLGMAAMIAGIAGAVGASRRHSPA